MKKHFPIACLSIFLGAISTGLYAQHVQVPLGRDTGAPPKPMHPASLASQERSDPIWSDDFSDPAHWSFGTLDSTSHNWVIGTSVPGGAYPMPAISSTSAANGYALFDSGLPCGPDNGYVAINDPVDLSGHAHVQLQFEQFYRKFQGRTWVDVSNDGSTWTPFEVNVQLNVGQYTANPEVFRLDISSVAAMQDSVWFRFRYTGNCDYAWMVDDVAIVDQPAHDLQLVTAATTIWNYNTNASFDSVYYSAFSYYETRPRALNMTYYNAGYMPAIHATASITTSDGYNESQVLDTVAPGDTVVWNAPLWTPAQPIDWYISESRYFYYAVHADDSDAYSLDNLDTLVLKVGGPTFMRNDTARDGAVGLPGQPFKVGNWFHNAVDQDAVAVGVEFATGSAVGIEVDALVYDDSLHVVAGTVYHVVSESELTPMGGQNVVDLCVYPPASLQAGKDYLVVLEHFGGADLLVATSGYSAPQSSLLYKWNEGTWQSISTTPVVFLDYIDSKSCWGGVDETAGMNGIDLYPCNPNPSADKTTVQYKLDAPARAVLTLHDLHGKRLRTLVDGPMGTGQHQVEVDTRSLDAGVYFYTLRTPAGMATKRMVVMH